MAGYKPGRKCEGGDVSIGMDCASSEFYKDGVYDYTKFEGAKGAKRSSKEQVEYLKGLVAKYPIDSIEDGMSENDWEGWQMLTAEIGDKLPARGRRPLRYERGLPEEGHRDGLRQLDPHQGKPDRYADRDARRHRDGSPRRLHVGYVAPFGRDRGFDDRRHRRGYELGPDQDRFGFAFGPYGQVQPAAPASRRNSATRLSTATRRYTASNLRRAAARAA